MTESRRFVAVPSQPSRLATLSHSNRQVEDDPSALGGDQTTR